MLNVRSEEVLTMLFLPEADWPTWGADLEVEREPKADYFGYEYLPKTIEGKTTHYMR